MGGESCQAERHRCLELERVQALHMGLESVEGMWQGTNLSVTRGFTCAWHCFKHSSNMNSFNSYYNTQ